jgi:hypothetical protein
MGVAVGEGPVVVRLPDGEPTIGIRSIAHLVMGYDPRHVDGATRRRLPYRDRDAARGRPVAPELG